MLGCFIGNGENPKGEGSLPCQADTKGALGKGPCKSMANDEKCRQINNLKDSSLLEMFFDLRAAAGQPGWQTLFLFRASWVATTGCFGWP